MKTHYLVTLCTALVVGAVLIAVPATALDVSKEKALVTDSWLTANAKIAFAADGRGRGSLPIIGYGVRSFHGTGEVSLRFIRAVFLER